MDLKTEKDIEQLRRIAIVLEAQVLLLLKQLAELRKAAGREDELQLTLDLLNTLQERALEIQVPPDVRKKPKKPQTGHGPTPQPDLPVVIEIVELDEPDKTCPSCAGQLEPWAGQFEESELVDVVKVEYRIVKVKRQKYRCRCGGCVETAEGGTERVKSGGRYSLAFGAKVAVDKYLDHSPLERQVRTLKRHGLKVTSQSLWDQIHTVAEELRPTYNSLLDAIKTRPVIGIDETSWRRLHKGSKSMKGWQMWGVTAPGAIYHAIRDDKSAESFIELVGDFEGKIIADAASNHIAGSKGRPIVMCFCWAHALRRFRDLEDELSIVSIPLAFIRQFYEIDKSADGDLEKLRKLRHTESRAVAGKLKEWLLANVTLYPKTLNIGKAIRYLLGNWKHFVQFLDDPWVPLDNNATERGLRGPVIGRKNHYGSKSKRGTEVAAILYSLLETAKLQGVNPAEYLAQAIDAARRGEVLLPGNFA